MPKSYLLLNIIWEWWAESDINGSNKIDILGLKLQTLAGMGTLRTRARARAHVRTRARAQVRAWAQVRASSPIHTAMQEFDPYLYRQSYNVKRDISALRFQIKREGQRLTFK